MKSRAGSEVPKMENRTSSPTSWIVIMITMRLSNDVPEYVRSTADSRRNGR